MTCNPFNTGVTKLFAECKYLLAYKMRFIIVPIVSKCVIQIKLKQTK
jgi:hypothetical protein